MIRACDECGLPFAPVYPDQWSCDNCEQRQLESIKRLEEIERGRAVMEAAAQEGGVS